MPVDRAEGIVRREVGHPLGSVRGVATFDLAVIVIAIPFLFGSARAAGASTAQANAADDELRFEVASIVPHRNSGSEQVGFEEERVPTEN